MSSKKLKSGHADAVSCPCAHSRIKNFDFEADAVKLVYIQSEVSNNAGTGMLHMSHVIVFHSEL